MRKTILIVEDDRLLADVYKKALVEEGYRVRLAEDYDQAMKQFKPGIIDLVVLDIILRKKNGFELMRDLRKIPGGEKVPLVIITGMGTQELDMDRDLMVSLNILGIHTKSQFSINQFVFLINNYLLRHEV